MKRNTFVYYDHGHIEKIDIILQEQKFLFVWEEKLGWVFLIMTKVL